VGLVQVVFEWHWGQSCQYCKILAFWEITGSFWSKYSKFESIKTIGFQEPLFDGKGARI